MKFLFIAMTFVFVLAGCGHSANFRDTTPGMAHTSYTDVGVFSTEANHDTAEESYYLLCMKRYAGYSGAAEECGYWIRAGRPGQLPQYQAGGYYPSYGGYYGGMGLPGYNQWPTPGRPYGY